MGRLTVGDLLAAARVLRDLPPERRDAAIMRMLDEVARAEAHVRRTGRAHPEFGGGSLMAVALRHGPTGEPFADDLTFLDALGRVIAAVRAVR